MVTNKKIESRPKEKGGFLYDGPSHGVPPALHSFFISREIWDEKTDCYPSTCFEGYFSETAMIFPII